MEARRVVYKLVLTGGPCGGKTTGQSRLCTFFENLGWKVYRIPETANTILSGGVKFSILNEEATFKFQENLLLTMLQLEKTFFDLSESCDQNCLVICDRGAMDPSVYIEPEKWAQILSKNKLDENELRDERYNQIVHLVSAADGAPQFYSIEDHDSRSEDLEKAVELERKASQAWVGHPYIDVIDNSTDFETKMSRLVNVVCERVGLEIGDRLDLNSKKRKFLIKPPPIKDLDKYVKYKEFDVIHYYLVEPMENYQVRLRKRGQQNGSYSYTHTVRKKVNDQVVEVRTHITHREFIYQLSQASPDHVPIHKKRRCFLIDHQYFQLDLYCAPCHPRCIGLILLETYTTDFTNEFISKLPKFLEIEKEVTGDPNYSMYNLSLKEEWENNEKFCVSLSNTPPKKEGKEEKE